MREKPAMQHAPRPGAEGTSGAALRGTLRLPLSSRTRRNHGVCLLGDELATVYSSRRAADGRAVTMTIGAGSVLLNGTMTPMQARALAQALAAAAAAAERAASCGAMPAGAANGGAA